MKRNRSPERYRRDRSFSISSLSSCSFNDLPSVRSRKQSVYNKDFQKSGSDVNRDKRHKSREYLKEQEKKSYKEHDKLKQGREKHKRYEKPEKEIEESYLSRASVCDRNEFNLYNNDIESSALDPSTCSYQAPFSLVKVAEKGETSGGTNARLDKLEKMVELLVYNKTQSNQTNTSQDNNSLLINIYELIPRNTNFTTSMWLNKINEECVERNFDEKTCIHFLQSKMSGIIKAWFKTLSLYDYTWPELKMLITKMFPDNTDFACTLRLLVERIKMSEETWTQYYFSKMYLLDACKITGANAVSCLIDGIEDPFLKEEVNSHNYLTPESLYSQFFSKLSDIQYDEIQQSYQDVDPYGVNDDLTSQYIDSKHDGQDFPQSSKMNPINKKCYTCGKVGHIAVDCRHAPLCYNCKLKGHIASKCPAKKEFK